MLHKRPSPNGTAPHSYWLAPVTSASIEAADAPESPESGDYKLLADNMPALCWMARSDGYIFWYNRRWHDYCGTTPKAMEGWGWQSVHDPAELPGVMEKWKASIASGQPFEMLFPIRGSDGVFRRFLTRIVPVRNNEGEVVRWLGTNIEVESQLNAEAALEVSEAKLQVLTDAMPQMVWSTLPNGHHDYYNARWYEFTGVPYGSTDGEGWNGVFHADDQERALDRWRHSLATGEPYEIEYRLRHHSGVYRWILGRALPVRDAHGAITRWIGTCTDIDEAKRNAALAELVSRELSHRIKNIFAVIAGLIGISSPKSADAAAYAKEVSGRIAALGRAHNFARPHGPESAILQDFGGLHGLLAELMSPYDYGQDRRYSISGQDVAVGDRSATPLALLIHELATNAVKYGALSEGKGRVAISTELKNDQVVIIWAESDGPTISQPPERTGFGTQLSDISIVSQLGGALDRAWNPEGLRVIISIPKAHL
jgi:PAS domain S-box-containing protein